MSLIKVIFGVTDMQIGGYYCTFVYTLMGANMWTIVEECY